MRVKDIGLGSDLHTMLDRVCKANMATTQVGKSSFGSSSTKEEDNSGDNLAKSVPHKSSKIRSGYWSSVKTIWEVWLVLLLIVVVGSFGIREWYSSYSILRMEAVLR